MSSVNSTPQPPVVWTIGGVDPTGLAGVGADNRAIAATGAYGLNIVTTVTAQNSNAFIGQQAMSRQLLDQQWLALLQQCPPEVIKIGLLANEEQVYWLADKLRQLAQRSPSVWIIYDPVFKASSAATVVVAGFIEAIKSELICQVDLLTPNIPEALLLLPHTATSPESLPAYAQALSQRYQCQVLLKGGHVNELFGDQANAQSYCYDYYARHQPRQPTKYTSEPANRFTLRQSWLAQANRRGTGCILASLIAGFVANNYTFCDAILLSNAALKASYTNALALGRGQGGAMSITTQLTGDDLAWISHNNGMASPHSSTEQAFASCPRQLGLYPVVDTVPWLTKLLEQGVKTVQLRVKQARAIDVEPMIINAIALGKEFKARVFINDYWQLAIKHGGYGVHLGQEDMLVADLAAIKQAGVRLGLSTHGVFEAQWAKQYQPSYMALGHIYQTQTKNMPSRPQGIDKLKRQVGLFNGSLPLVAIGGISLDRIDEVMASDIGSIALVTAITRAKEPEHVVSSLLQAVGTGGEYE